MLAGWCEDVLSSCSSPLFSSVSLETNFVEQVVRRGCSSHLCRRHGHHCCCCSSSSAAATICSSSPCSRAFPPPSCSLRSSHHPPMCAGTSPCCLPLPTYSRASEGISRSSCGCSSSSTSRGQPTPPLHCPPSAPSLPRLSCALLPRCVHSRTMDPDYTAWSSYAQATPCFPHVHPFAWCHVAPKHQGTKRST